MKKILATIIAMAMILSTASIGVFALEEAELELYSIGEITENEEIVEEISEVEAMAATELYVSSDYNSSTEGWGITHFGNYSSALNYAKTNAKNATIVIEKTNTISGNCIDQDTHKNLTKLAVVINGGATMGNANSKWDMTYPVTIKAGGILQSGRPASASAGYVHVKNTLTIGEEGAAEKAMVKFHKGSYQDINLGVLYNGRIVANNAVINVKDLGLTGSGNFTDCELYVNGCASFGLNTLNQHKLINTTMHILGHNSRNDTYFLGYNQLNGLTMDNSTVIIDDNEDGRVSNELVIKKLTMNGSSVTVEKDTPVTVSGKVEMNDSEVNAGVVTVDSKGSIIVNGSEVDALSANAGSDLNADELIIDGELTLNPGAAVEAGNLVVNSTLNVAPGSKIKFESIENNGTINIDTSNGGIFEIFEYTGDETMTEDDYKAIVGEENWSDSFEIVDGNLWNADYSMLFVNADWKGVAADTKVGEGLYYGKNAFSSVGELSNKILTDGSDTTIKLLSDVELEKVINFTYGKGDVIFTADEPVVMKQTALGSDFVFEVREENNIIIDENVNLQIYDNASGLYVFYGPSLVVKGSVTGGQNWGCFYPFYKDHIITETGIMDIGRVQAGFCEFTVNGELKTNYLLNEAGTFIADGGKVNAGVIHDSNNGGIRYGASEFKFINGAEITANSLTFGYADSKVTIDTSAKINIGEIKGAGKIIIDAKEYTGGKFEVTADLSAYTGKIEVINETEEQLVAVQDENGNFSLVKAAACIVDANGEETYYATLKETLDNAVEDSTIVIPNGNVIEEGKIVLPASLKNVTISAENLSRAIVPGAPANAPVIKDTIFVSPSTAFTMDNVSVKGIVFENSGFNITAWGAPAEIKNITFDGNTFKNFADSANNAPIHFNVDGAYAVKGLTVINNVFDTIGKSQNSAIYSTNDGNIIIENNIFKGIAFRTFVIHLVNNNGTADSSIVRNNVVSASPVGRIQVVGLYADGTDNVNLNVNNNILSGITDASDICCWDFNDETLDADLSGNYFDSEPASDPAQIYLNKKAENIQDLRAMKVFPYYNGLLDETSIDYSKIVTGVTDEINIQYAVSEINEDEGYMVYDIVLTGTNGDVINRLNTADITFELSDSDVIYEVTPEEDITLTREGSDRYMFNFDGKDDVEDTAVSIVIGQVKFSGYDGFTFKIAQADTNLVTATTLVDNIVDYFAPGAGLVLNTDVDPADDDALVGIIEGVIEVPVKDLKINIDFNNAVAKKAEAYQQMTVKVSGGDLENDIIIKLSDDAQNVIIDEANKAKAEYTVDVSADNKYVVTLNDVLAINTTYQVEVTGAGYRTARYTVIMNKEKELFFWNNVKDAADYMEDGKESSKKAVNFLAGDIVKDNIINIYDLSAVVSYFGEDKLQTANPGYAKYDLNRDGKIDSKDVAYVLVSWGK